MRHQIMRRGRMAAVTVGILVLALGRPLAQEAERPIDPTRFAEAIEAFEAEDRVSPPPEGAVVVTGSSSIRRWHPTMREDLAPLTVVPRGFGGSTMADLLHYVDRIVIPYRPRAVVVYEGDNDTGMYFVPPARIVDQFEALVSRIHTALPATRIYVLSVKPSVLRAAYWDAARDTNERLRAVAAGNPLVTYVDMATPLLQRDGTVMTDIFVEDGLHLNDKGTRIWAATIKAALMPVEARHEPAR